MDIFKPDKEVSKEADKKDAKKEELDRRTTRLVEVRMPGGLSAWVPQDQVTPKQKIRADRRDQVITAKADIRSSSCWMKELAGCKNAPRVWVREVHFDLQKPGANITFASVSTDDYVGAIPGFCLAHEDRGAELLSEAIFQNRPEIKWGYRPTRSVIIFTDGSKKELTILTTDEIVSKDAHLRDGQEL